MLDAHEQRVLDFGAVHDQLEAAEFGDGGEGASYLVGHHEQSLDPGNVTCAAEDAAHARHRAAGCARLVGEALGDVSGEITQHGIGPAPDVGHYEHAGFTGGNRLMGLGVDDLDVERRVDVHAAAVVGLGRDEGLLGSAVDLTHLHAAPEGLHPLFGSGAALLAGDGAHPKRQVLGGIDAGLFDVPSQLVEERGEGEQPGHAAPAPGVDVLLAHSDAAGNHCAADGPVGVIDDRPGDDPVVHDRDVDHVLTAEPVGVEAPGGVVDGDGQVLGGEVRRLRAGPDVLTDDLVRVNTQHRAVGRRRALIVDDLLLRQHFER